MAYRLCHVKPETGQRVTQKQMKYLDPVKETVRALGFLSRLPLPDRYFSSSAETKITDSAGMFPAAGAIIGIPAALILIVSGIVGLPPMPAAVIATIALIVTSGALHEDGLADVADGFWGGRDVEKRLAIMKDPHLGTYGTIALICALALRMACLAAIIVLYGPWSAAAIVIAVSAASRGAMVWFWSALPPVRQDGVSAKAGNPEDEAVWLAMALAGVAMAGIAWPAIGFLATITATGLALLVLAGFKTICLDKIGGQTGDTLGAAQQLVEMALLLGLAMFAAMPI